MLPSYAAWLFHNKPKVDIDTWSAVHEAVMANGLFVGHVGVGIIRTKFTITTAHIPSCRVKKSQGGERRHKNMQRGYWKWCATSHACTRTPTRTHRWSELLGWNGSMGVITLQPWSKWWAVSACLHACNTQGKQEYRHRIYTEGVLAKSGLCMGEWVWVCSRQAYVEKWDTRTAKQDVKRAQRQTNGVLEKEVVLMMCQAVLFPIREGNGGVQVCISETTKFTAIIQTCNV